MSALQIELVCAVEIGICTLLIIVATLYLIKTCRMLQDALPHADSEPARFSDPVSPASRSRGKHDAAPVSEAAPPRVESARYDSDMGATEWTGVPEPYTPADRIARKTPGG